MSRKVFEEQEPGESLDVFSQHCVATPAGELAKLNREVDEFVRFLHQQFARNQMSVAKVVKSGSLGKGTAVRKSADIDLVVYFNGLSSVYDLIDNRESLLDKIEERVRSYLPWADRISLENKNMFSCKYMLDGNEVDLLPAFALDISNEKRNKELMYAHMAAVAKEQGGGNKGQDFVASQFSASLAPLQENGLKRDLRSYTVELVTIHTAKAAGRNISTNDLFTRCLEVLAGSRSMEVYFEENYAVGHGTCYGSSALWSHSVPMVMDVANPYNNVLLGTDTQKISKKAQETLLLLSN